MLAVALLAAGDVGAVALLAVGDVDADEAAVVVVDDADDDDADEGRRRDQRIHSTQHGQEPGTGLSSGSGPT